MLRFFLALFAPLLLVAMSAHAGGAGLFFYKEKTTFTPTAANGRVLYISTQGDGFSITTDQVCPWIALDSQNKIHVGYYKAEIDFSNLDDLRQVFTYNNQKIVCIPPNFTKEDYRYGWCEKPAPTPWEFHDVANINDAPVCGKWIMYYAESDTVIAVRSLEDGVLYSKRKYPFYPKTSCLHGGMFITYDKNGFSVFSLPEQKKLFFYPLKSVKYWAANDRHIAYCQGSCREIRFIGITPVK